MLMSHTPQKDNSPLSFSRSDWLLPSLAMLTAVAQHCMEGMGEETLFFPLLKSGKRQKVHLGLSVSTHFVADCSFQQLLSESYHRLT